MPERLRYQQGRYKLYVVNRRRRSHSSIQIDDRLSVRLLVRLSKLNTVWFDPQEIVQKPSADTERLSDGTAFNAEWLKRDHSAIPLKDASDEFENASDQKVEVDTVERAEFVGACASSRRAGHDLDSRN